MFVPSWTYELEAPIRIPAGVTLVGDEGGSRVVAIGESPAFVLDGDNIRLCRLVVSRRDRTQGPEAAGVIVESGSVIHIDRCLFTGHPRCGILFRSGSGTVEQNAFTDCGEAAVVSDGADVTMDGNEVEEGVKEIGQGIA